MAVEFRSPLGFRRTSVAVTSCFLLMWLGCAVSAWVAVAHETSSCLLKERIAGHSPLSLMSSASFLFAIWLVSDFFRIRRSPPEFRKSEYATTGIMLLLLILVAATMEPVTAAMIASPAQR